MRHLISLKEQSGAELRTILDEATRLKKEARAGKIQPYLAGKILILYFEKPSTRTRLSFDSAMAELGGHPVLFDVGRTQFSLADFRDEIQAVMRFGDVLMMRALRAADVYTAASFNRIPIIDGCSEKYHPCQTLADILTMAEYSGGVEKIGKVAWLGPENNVSNTLKIACAKLGIKIALATPEKANPANVDPELNVMAEATGLVTVTHDVKEALDGAAYVHTDTWMDMEFFQNGKIRPEYEAEYERRKKAYLPYQISTQLLEKYAPHARIMHCMPMHVGYEITRDAIDHPNAVILDQAENRKHAQKAIIMWLLGVSAR